MPGLSLAELGHGAWLLLPELALVLTALVVLSLDLFMSRDASRRPLAWVAVLGVAASALFALSLLGSSQAERGAFGRFLVVDDFAIFFDVVFLLACGLVILSAETFTERVRKYEAEFYVVMLFCTVGLMLMASTGELISVYLSLELSSLSLAFLASWSKRDAKSTEAGMKFFLLSAMSSAVLLYGLALLYGMTGSTSLDRIAQLLSDGATTGALLALAMVGAGFGFKIAAVPFQMWTPDVYEGSPTPVTAFFSTASKAAGFAVLLRVFHTALPQIDPQWTATFAVLAFLTMTVGNVVALVQTNIKRMLAYSSIAHVGYMLVGLAAGTQLAASSLMFYLLVYTVTNLAAFIAVIIMARFAPDDLISSYAGLHQRSPWLSFGLAVALLSLAGLPPLAGFFSKLYLFWAAAEAQLYFLVVWALLNSALSLFYYARVIRQMYFAPAEQSEPVTSPWAPAASLGLATAGVFLFGIFSAPLIGSALAAAQAVVK